MLKSLRSGPSFDCAIKEDICLFTNTHLRKLSLAGTSPFRDQLITLKDLPLENLDLSGTFEATTDDDIPYLLLLKDRLKELDLNYTEVSEDGIARLVSEMPETKIYYHFENHADNEADAGP